MGKHQWRLNHRPNHGLLALNHHIIYDKEIYNLSDLHSTDTVTSLVDVTSELRGRLVAVQLYRPAWVRETFSISRSPASCMVTPSTKAAESQRRSQRVVESHGESWRVTESHGGLQSITEGHGESQIVTKHHTESKRITES